MGELHRWECRGIELRLVRNGERTDLEYWRPAQNLWGRECGVPEEVTSELARLAAALRTVREIASDSGYNEETRWRMTKEALGL